MLALEEARIFKQTKSLSAVINAAQYSVRDTSEISREMVKELLDMDEIIVERETKKGVKVLDIRPLIYALIADENRLDMILALGSQGNVRPTEVLETLNKIKPFDREISSFKIFRISLFVKTVDEMLSPIDVV